MAELPPVPLDTLIESHRLITLMRENGLDPVVIATAYGWTYDVDGEVHGLTAGDQGYEASGIKFDPPTMDILRKAGAL
jgi:hypothetical protein